MNHSENSVAGKAEERIAAALACANVAGEIQVYGSIINGFHTTLSDLDFTLITTGFVNRSDSVAILKLLMLTLREEPFVKYFHDVISVFEATVPILKFAMALDESESCIVDENLAESPKVLEIDLSVNNFLGVRNSKLLSMYCEYDNRIAQLGVIIKTWAKQRELVCAPDGYLNTYTYMLLIIFYAQCGCTPPVAPNLQAISDQNDPQTLSDANGVIWSTAFESDLLKIKPSSNTQSVESLLMGFFAFYTRTVKWDAVAVSIRLGSLAVLKDTLQCFGANEEDQWCIEDPFDLRRNLAANCTLAARMRILSAMQTALVDLETNKLASVMSSPLVFGTKYYYLRCSIYKSMAPQELFDHFYPYGLRMMYFPQSTVDKIAFFAFDSVEDRRKAHTKNESFIGDMQLQLHCTSENFLADVYHAEKYVVYPVEIAKKDDESVHTFNPKTEPFVPQLQTRYVGAGYGSEYSIEAQQSRHFPYTPQSTGSYGLMWEDSTNATDATDAFARAKSKTTLELADRLLFPAFTSEDHLVTGQSFQDNEAKLDSRHSGMELCETAQFRDASGLALLTDLIEKSWNESPMRMLPQIQLIIRTPAIMLPLRLLGIRLVIGLLATGDACSEARIRAVNSFFDSDLLPDLLVAACGTVAMRTKLKDEAVPPEAMTVASFVAQFTSNSEHETTDANVKADACSVNQFRRESACAVRLLCSGNVDVLVGEMLRAMKKMIKSQCPSTEYCSQVLLKLATSVGCLSTLWELKAPSVIITLIRSPILMRSARQQPYTSILSNCVGVLACLTTNGTFSDRLKLLEWGVGDLFTQLCIAHSTDGLENVVDDCVRALSAFACKDDINVRPPVCARPSEDSSSVTFGALVEILRHYGEHRTIAMNVMSTMAGLCRDSEILTQQLPSVLHAVLLVLAQESPWSPLVSMAVLLLSTIAEKCTTWLTEAQIKRMVSGIAEQMKPGKTDGETLRIVIRTLAQLCEEIPQITIPAVLAHRACWTVINCAATRAGTIRAEAIRVIWAIVEPSTDSLDKVEFCRCLIYLLTKLICNAKCSVQDILWHVFFGTIYHLTFAADAHGMMAKVIDSGLFRCFLAHLVEQLKIMKAIHKYANLQNKGLQVGEMAFIGRAIVVLSWIIEYGTQAMVTSMSENREVTKVLYAVLQKPDVYIAVPIAHSSPKTHELFARSISAALSAVVKLRMCHVDEAFFGETLITNISRFRADSHACVSDAAKKVQEEIAARPTEVRCSVAWTIFVELLYPDLTDSTPIHNFRLHAQSCRCTLCQPLSVYVSQHPLFVAKYTVDNGANAMTASPGAVILNPRIRHLAVQALLRMFSSPQTLAGILDEHEETTLATLRTCASLLASKELLDGDGCDDALRALEALISHGVWHKVACDMPLERLLHLLRRDDRCVVESVVRIVRKLHVENPKYLGITLFEEFPIFMRVLSQSLGKNDIAVCQVCKLISVCADDVHFDVLSCLIESLLQAMRGSATRSDAVNAFFALVYYGKLTTADHDILAIVQIIRDLIKEIVAVDPSADCVKENPVSSFPSVGCLMLLQLVATLSILLSSASTKPVSRLPVGLDVVDAKHLMEELHARTSTRVQALANDVLGYLAKMSPKPSYTEGPLRRAIESPISKSSSLHRPPIARQSDGPYFRPPHSEYLASATARLQVDLAGKSQLLVSTKSSNAKGANGVNPYFLEAKSRNEGSRAPRDIVPSYVSKRPAILSKLPNLAENTYLAEARLRMKYHEAVAAYSADSKSVPVSDRASTGATLRNFAVQPEMNANYRLNVEGTQRARRNSKDTRGSTPSEEPVAPRLGSSVGSEINHPRNSRNRCDESPTSSATSYFEQRAEAG